MRHPVIRHPTTFAIGLAIFWICAGITADAHHDELYTQWSVFFTGVALICAAIENNNSKRRRD